MHIYRSSHTERYVCHSPDDNDNDQKKYYYGV